jgi:hypothetical protein
MSSTKQLARIAGVFYLLVGIFGGFAEGFVDPKLHVAGNAAASAGNVVANADLVRMGVVAHLVDGVFFALTAMALYLLLNHVHKNAARSMVIFVVIAVAMICLNAAVLFEGMQVATDPTYVTAFGVAGSSALVMVLLDIQHYGTLAAQVFFGLWLAPLGYLAYRSGLFPKALGVVLVLATISYLTDSLTAFLLPNLELQIKPLLIVAPLVGEIWMVVYLLVKGVKSGRQTDPAPVAGLVPVRPEVPLRCHRTGGGIWPPPVVIGSADSVRTERSSGPSRSRLGTTSLLAARPA